MAPRIATPEVVYEDGHLLIAAKPAGMPVQPDASADPSLIDWAEIYLRERYQKPGKAFVGLVHRIDRPVGGLVILAKTSKALARMNEALAARAVDKRYLALVDPTPQAPEGSLVDYLLKDAKTNTSRRVSPAHRHGLEARLHYRTLAPPTAEGALLEVTLETGRHHQIRVQLSSMGSPIVGDVKYGSRRPLGHEMRLHAWRLSFDHPVAGHAPVSVEHRPPWAPAILPDAPEVTDTTP